MIPDLPSETVDWLLNHELPTVRYQALRYIKGLAEDDPDVINAKRKIMTTGPVHRILQKQDPGGFWYNPGDFYQRHKYKGTSWNLIVMAEMEADGADERVRSAGMSMLLNSQVRENGGFSYKGTSENGGFNDGTLSCLTANMVWSLLYLGIFDDDRVWKGVDWIVRYQRFSPTPPQQKTMPYIRARCWSPHDCRSAAVKCLRALAAVPPADRTEEIDDAIVRGRDFVLNACIGIDNGGLQAKMRNDWLDLGYPNTYNTDILEIALRLRALGVKEDLLSELKEQILGMMDDRMRLIQRSTMTNRLLTRVEKVGEPSGLLTIRAYQLFH